MAWRYNANGRDSVGSTLELTKVDGQRAGKLLIELKALALEAGWSVTATGDGGSSYEFQGSTGGAGTGTGGDYDVLTGFTDAGTGGAGDAGTPRAWMLLTDPNGAQLIIQTGSSAGTGWDMYINAIYSPGGGYSATGCTALNPPAALADERIIRGSRNGSGANVVPFGAGTHLYSILFDDAEADGTYRFLFYCVTSAGTPHDCFGVMTFDYYPSWETAPWFILGGHTNANSSTSPAGLWEVQSEGQSAERSIAVSTFLSNTIYASGWAPNGTNDDPVTGETIVATIPYLRQFGVANEEYGPLIMTDVLVRTESGGPDYPDFLDWNGMRFVHYDDLLLPFGTTADANVPAGGTDSGATVLDIRPSAGGALDTTAPTLTNVSPASGSTIGAADSVTFDVTDETGLREVIVAVEFLASGSYEVVHDGTSFAQAYRSSSRTAVTGGYRYTVSRAGGWPSSPQIRIFAIDTSGNEL